MRYTDKIISFKHTTKRAISLLIVSLNQLMAHRCKALVKGQELLPRTLPYIFTMQNVYKLRTSWLNVFYVSIQIQLLLSFLSWVVQTISTNSFALWLLTGSDQQEIVGRRRVRLSPIPLSKCSHQPWAPVRWSSLFALHTTLPFYFFNSGVVTSPGTLHFPLYVPTPAHTL